MREEFNNEKIALKKGNVSEVFSDGRVVYRDLKPQSKSVHRLLLHLEEKGIFLDSYGMRNANEVLLKFLKENMADWL